MPMLDLRSGRFKDLGLLSLRLVAGIYLAIGHGWPKIAGSVEAEGWMSAVAGTLGSGTSAFLLSLIAISLELFGGLLTALGFSTRVVSALLVLYVPSAYLIGVSIKSFELTLLYGSVFLALFLTGPGEYSIDEYLTVEDSPAYVVVNSTEMSADES